MEGASGIFLVRHGEAAASWGVSADPPLSELGKEQAQAAAAVLCDEFPGAPRALVSSPLSRAQETAVPLANLFGLPVQIDERFREIPAPVPLAERQDWLRAFMRQRWEAQPAEVQAWRERLLSGVRELQPGTVLFTHFLVINTIVGALSERSETLMFWPANASITRLDYANGQLQVRQLGEELASRVN